jgi:hypothetical protein
VKPLLAILLACAGLHAPGAVAQIQFDAFLHPRPPSRNDAVYVGYGLTCGYPVPDPDHPPRVRRMVGERDLQVTVDIYLMRDPIDQMCPGIPPGPTFALVDIGPIADHVDYIYATRRVWLLEGASQTPINVAEDRVAIYDAPSDAISGTWWSPQVPGTLTNLLLASHPGYAYGELIVTTQQFNEEGRPVSLTAIGRFDGPEFSAAALVPERTGPNSTDVEARTIGTLTLTYRGCRTATLQLASASSEFASFEHDLEQISWPRGVRGCELNPSFVLPSIIDTAP